MAYKSLENTVRQSLNRINEWKGLDEGSRRVWDKTAHQTPFYVHVTYKDKTDGVERRTVTCLKAMNQKGAHHKAADYFKGAGHHVVATEIRENIEAGEVVEYLGEAFPGKKPDPKDKKGKVADNGKPLPTPTDNKPGIDNKGPPDKGAGVGPSKPAAPVKKAKSPTSNGEKEPATDKPIKIGGKTEVILNPTLNQDTHDADQKKKVSDQGNIKEGWLKHSDGHHSAWASEVEHHIDRDGAVKCPKCSTKMAKITGPVRNREQEIMQWNHTCPNSKCGTMMTVFNDEIELEGKLLGEDKAREVELAQKMAAQKAARLSGAPKQEKKNIHVYRKAFVTNPDRLTHSFDQFARQENLKRKPYSWMTTGPGPTRSEEALGEATPTPMAKNAKFTDKGSRIEKPAANNLKSRIEKFVTKKKLQEVSSYRGRGSYNPLSPTGKPTRAGETPLRKDDPVPAQREINSHLTPEQKAANKAKVAAWHAKNNTKKEETDMDEATYNKVRKALKEGYNVPGSRTDWLNSMKTINHLYNTLARARHGDDGKLVGELVDRIATAQQEHNVKYVMFGEESEKKFSQWAKENQISEASHSEGGGEKRAGQESGGGDNIIHQLRKVVNLKQAGGSSVKFADGNSGMVHHSQARAAVDKYMSHDKPADKEAHSKALGHSHASFRDTIAGKPHAAATSSAPKSKISLGGGKDARAKLHSFLHH